MKTDYRLLRPYRDYQRQRMLARRLGALRGAVSLGFVILLAVFWYLQIVRGAEHRALAEENRLHRRIERALRGALLDLRGVAMTSHRPSFAVHLAPERTANAPREVAALARALDAPVNTLLDQYERARRAQPRYAPVLLLADVGLETAARIEAHRIELPAIDVEMTAKRAYALGPAAAHVLGYVSEVTERELTARRDLLLGDRVGRTGAERIYDAELCGRAGILLEEVNASGRPLGLVAAQRQPRNGRALRLTVDAALQRDLAEAFGDSSGAAVFLDPFTGGVRALYSAPSFDPNVFGGRLTPATWSALSADPTRPLQNRAVASAYSPGSTFKIVMAVAALEEGLVTPAEQLHCRGSAVFYGRPFLCWRKGGHGAISIQDAITRSCNVFFYNMGRRLGAERIAKWAHRFGVGEPSGIRFEHEALGLVANDQWSQRVRRQPVYPGEVISMAIGQGLVQVSPLQNAVIAAAIANGGYRVHPHLVDRPDAAAAPETIGVSPETLTLVREGMRNVVESDWGTARRARVPGRLIAGKTGTAQTIAREAEDQLADNAWFIGFGPVDRPELAWAIIIERGGHGGEAAAPIAGLVLRRHFERQTVEGLGGPGGGAIAAVRSQDARHVALAR